MNPRLKNKLLHPGPSIWLMPITTWMLCFFVLPVGYMFLVSFMSMIDYQLTHDWTLSNYQVIFERSLYHRAYLNSLFLSIRVVLITTLIAYPLGYALVFVVPKQWRLVFLVAIIAPFWTNYLVRAYAWQTILSNTGIINYALISLGIIGEPIDILYTHRATTIGLTHYLLAIMTLNVYTTLENIDLRLIEAAKDLGANSWQAFWRITLPLSSGGLITGAMFIFVLAFADFVSPSVLGGQTRQVFPQLVVDAIQWNVNWPLASAFAVIMVATILIVLGIMSRWMNLGKQTKGSVK